MLYIAQLVKNLPAMQETGVRFLGWEAPGEGTGNPLQYSCLENPHGQRRLVGYSPRGHKEAGVTERLGTAQRQYACLENRVGRGAWRAAAHGVAGLDATDGLSTHACPGAGDAAAPGRGQRGWREPCTMSCNTLSLAFGERVSISAFSCLVASFMSSSGLKGSRAAA